MQQCLAQCIALLGLMLIFTPSSDAHGRLSDPPARSTMWRFGFNTPINYIDNELFCGGFQHQVNLGYKCGICGDPWDGEREHEAGGRYATGTIGRAYRQGSKITVTVDLTANHKGFFEFKLCPVNDPAVKATQECLDSNTLTIGDSPYTKYAITTEMGSREIDIDLTLPAHLVCSQCVLQWRYHAGNSWGVNQDDGLGCIGCGYQEEFYGCADIQILAPGQPLPTTILDGNDGGSGSGSGSGGTGVGTGGGSGGGSGSGSGVGSGSGSGVGTGGGTSSGSGSGTDRGSGGGSGSGSGAGSGGGSGAGSGGTGSGYSGGYSGNGDNIVCHGVRSDHDNWCQLNCQRNYCPASYCSCTAAPYPHANPPPPGCRAAGVYADLTGYNTWCRNNCAMGFCPSSICVCTSL